MNPGEIPLHRLYDDLARLWPLMSPPEEYAEEAGFWRAVLRETLGPGRHEILELGAGGGHNLSHLAGDFDAVAVDLSEKMLDHSRKLNPSVSHVVGDMRTIRLGRGFKAVLIHDAVSHLLSERDLLAALRTAAAHLEPGGVLLAAPDNYRDTFSAPRVEYATNSSGKTRLTYFEYTHDPDPADTVIETIFTYFIHEEGALRIEYDRFLTGLFPKSAWARLFEIAGFAFRERSFRLESTAAEYIILTGKLIGR